MPTATAGKLSLEGVAKACGIASACTVEDAEEFGKRVQAALSERGPHFIAAKVEALDDNRPAKVRRLPDPRENKYRFVYHIERTEGVEILGSGLGKWS